MLLYVAPLIYNAYAYVRSSTRSQGIGRLLKDGCQSEVKEHFTILLTKRRNDETLPRFVPCNNAMCVCV